MEQQTKKISCLSLLLTFMKLGLFSFGGGPAMLMLIKDEIVEKKHWMSDEELTEMVGLSESTPGPFAINLATHLGYKKRGFLGSLCATLGVALPTFLIMFIISLLFRNLMQYEVVQYAFMGVKCAVIFLILRVGINLAKGVKSPFPLILFLIVSILMIVFNYTGIDFSAVYFILIGAFLGLLFYSFIVPHLSKKKEEEKKRIELVTTASRDFYLAKSETDSPVDSPLIGIDALLRSFQFSFEDPSVKAASFHKNVHACGASYGYEEIKRNQNGLLPVG